MSALAAGLSVVCLLTSQGESDEARKERARELFRRAETSIVAEQFCDAAQELALFYELTADTTALYNSAVAAHKGGDRALAKTNLERFLQLSPLSALRPRAEARGQAIQQEIEALGKGTVCPKLLLKPIPEQTLPALASSQEHPVAKQKNPLGLSLLVSGGVSVLTGAGFSLAAYLEKRDLEDRRGETRTFDAAQEQEILRFERNRDIGLAAFAGGAVLLSAGVLLLWLAPDS